MTAFDPDEFLSKTPPAAAPPIAGFDPDAFLAPPGPPPAAPPIYRGALLPFSRDAQGVSFDPFGSGPIGAIRQAFTLPGRVMSGETRVDPANPNFIGEAVNFAGSVGPAVNPMVRSGDRAIPGIRMAPKDPSLAVVPTSAALLERGGEQLNAFRDLPIKYDPKAFGSLAVQTEQDLLKHGVLRENSPQLYAFLDTLRKTAPPGATVHAEPANLMAMRENLAGLFGKQNEHQKGVGVAFDKLNQFIEKPPAGAVLAGSPAFLEAYAPELYARGRANYAAGKRGEGLEDIKKTADLRAASAHSGANTDNSLRSRIASLVLDAKKTKGFTEPELAALTAVPEGTTGRNAMRYAGNVLGGGGGLGAVASSGTAATAAAYLGLPPSIATGIGAATPAVGAYLKRKAGISTEQALDEAIDMTKRRSPLFQDMGRQDLVPDAVRSRDAIARALLRLETLGVQGLPISKPVLEYDPNRA